MQLRGEIFRHHCFFLESNFGLCYIIRTTCLGISSKYNLQSKHLLQLKVNVYKSQIPKNIRYENITGSNGKYQRILKIQVKDKNKKGKTKIKREKIQRFRNTNIVFKENAKVKVIIGLSGVNPTLQQIEHNIDYTLLGHIGMKKTNSRRNEMNYQSEES